MKMLCSLLLCALSFCLKVDGRSYNTGLIFYNLENHNTYLPPTISVSRGRGLAKYKYSPRGSIWSTFGKPCNCEGPLCACCVGLKVKQFNFDQKMCANVSYRLPKDEIQLEIFLNDTSTAKYGIAARNPSPLCVPIMMGIPMSMCIQMSNIAVQGDNLNMCMDFLVRLASTELFEMHFQCMKMGLQGISWVGSSGQPVIPPNEGKIQIKDKIINESDEYYDESEANEQENEIVPKEQNAGNGVKEGDSNAAEEEEDDNDITEKIMDIVKEKEQEDDEWVEEHKNKDPSQLNVEEFVTNIMNSINEGKASEEQPQQMEDDKNKTTDTGKWEAEENETEMSKGNEQTVKQDINAEADEVESNKDISADDVSAHADENGSHMPELLESSQTAEMQMGSNNKYNAEQGDMSTAAVEKQESETDTQHTANDQEYSAEEKFEMLIDAEEIDKTDHQLNTTLQVQQQTIETTTEHLMAANLEQTVPQSAAVTSETDNTNNMDNAVTTAAMMNARPTTTTAAYEPTKSAEHSSAVAEIVITNTNNNDVVKNTNEKDDDEDDNDDDNDQDEDEDNENSAGDDDNSHENDSDYDDDEESEEDTADDIKEMKSNNTATIVMSNENGIRHKEPSTSLELANESDSNESHSHEDTNDEFEIEEGESVENVYEKGPVLAQEQHDKVSEEDYEGEYENYHRTATTTTIHKTVNDANGTCCKAAVSFASHNQPGQMSDTSSKNNSQFVSKSNPTISHTQDVKLLSADSSTSSNKMSQIISNTSGRVNSKKAAKAATSINAMPLPLARKLYALRKHKQSYTQHHHTHQHQH